MAITIQPEPFYDDLIKEAFNTKNSENPLNSLRTKADLLGYSLDNIDSSSGYKDDNESVFGVVRDLIENASISDKIGYIYGSSYGILDTKVYDVVLWLRQCGMLLASIDTTNNMLWYTTPELKMEDGDPIFKEKIDIMIELNNSDNSNVSTQYNKEYVDTRYANSLIPAMKHDIEQSAITAKRLEDIRHIPNCPIDVANKLVEWLKISGFDKAHTKIDEAGVSIIHLA